MSKRISRFTIHRSTEPCWKCGAVGHSQRDCNTKEAPKIPYRKYLEVNRLAWQGLTPADLVCVRCDGKGHKADNCPQVREEEGEEGGDFTEVVVSDQHQEPVADDSPPCRNCGENHKTADCYHKQFDEKAFISQKSTKLKVVSAPDVTSVPSAFDLPLKVTPRPPGKESTSPLFPPTETALGTTIVLRKQKKRKASAEGKKKKKKRKKGLVGYDSESE